MAKIIEKFKDMPDRQSLDCRINSFSDILWHHGINIDAHTLLVLGGGINFGHVSMTMKKLGNFPIWSIGSSVTNFDETIINNMSLPNKVHIIPNDDDGTKKIIEFINRDIPLMFLYDAREVTTDHVMNSRNASLNIQIPSLALFVGYNLENKTFYVNLKTPGRFQTPFQEAISAINNARNSKCLPFSPGNKCYEILIDDNYKNWLNENIDSLIVESIVKNSKKMLEGGRIQLDIDDETIIQHEIIEGIAGYRRLIKEINEFGLEIKEMNFKEEIINKLFKVKFMALREGAVQGSHTGSREEYAVGLINVAERLNNKQLKKIGKSFDEVAGEWRAFLRLLYNVESGLKDKDKYIAKVTGCLTKIAEKEEYNFKEIIKIFN